MYLLFKKFQTVFDIVNPFAHSHWNPSFRLRILWQAVPPEIGHEEAHFRAHGSEASSLLFLEITKMAVKIWLDPSCRLNHAQSN